MTASGVPAGPGDDREGRAWERLVRLLTGTYTAEGVAVWLSARNRLLPDCGEGDCDFTCTPLDYIREGRIGDVIAVAERMTGDPA